jgi:carbonic anhydrase/acetyltransferase-like protein (isoleucine patch superfamily)
LNSILAEVSIVNQSVHSEDGMLLSAKLRNNKNIQHGVIVSSNCMEVNLSLKEHFLR